MRVFSKVKVFDFNNPNVTIANDVDDIMNMLEYCPVVANVDDIVDSKVVGLICRNTLDFKCKEIFGDIILKEDYHNLKGNFKNYGVTGYYKGDEWVISGVSWVEIE